MLGSTIMSNPAAPAFTLQGRDGGARVGTLRLKHGVVHTPALFNYTRRGAPLSMTPDMLEMLKPTPSGYQLDTLQFLNNPDPTMMLKYGRGAHEFLALPSTVPLLASNRDPTMYEYGGKPSSDGAVFVTIHSGAIQVTPEKYMSAIQALQPDIYVTLCDEVTYDASARRVAQSVNRTDKWLEQCLAAQARLGVDALPLASVTGGGSLEERKRAAACVADKQVAGYSVSGLGTGEPPAERPQLIAAALQHLPEDRPRFVSGMLTPTEVLDAIAEGIDMFDCGYVTQLTSSGYASVAALQPPWPLDPAGTQTTASSAAAVTEGEASSRAVGVASTSGLGASGIADSTPVAELVAAGTDGTRLNMWAVQYRLDPGPLQPGCTCFTCRRHTRSYVHHLLQAHEMLAEVLLEVHNTQHINTFMECVRAAIKGGTFVQYRQWFQEQHRRAGQPDEVPHNPLVTFAAKRPRSDVPEAAAAARAPSHAIAHHLSELTEAGAESSMVSPAAAVSADVALATAGKQGGDDAKRPRVK